MNKQPRLGTGIIIKKDNKVLLKKRTAKQGAGTWCFPGGWVEFKETLEQCAIRETREEAGIEITNIKLGPYTENIHQDADIHDITFFLIADHKSGEPQIMEPDKCACWQWFDWDKLPQPLFLPIQNLLKQGFNPFT